MKESIPYIVYSSKERLNLRRVTVLSLPASGLQRIRRRLAEKAGELQRAEIPRVLRVSAAIYLP